MRLLTIGVYGATERTFFDALERAHVDTFVDIRHRRGVRGHEHAFANATRLQARLAELGIRYVHLKELAPPQALLDLQRDADVASHTKRRDRSRMSDAFVAGYREACLRHFSWADFLEAVGPAEAACLFCVEGPPEACHRSLAAEHLASQAGMKVEHLRP